MEVAVEAAYAEGCRLLGEAHIRDAFRVAEIERLVAENEAIHAAHQALVDQLAAPPEPVDEPVCASTNGVTVGPLS